MKLIHTADLHLSSPLESRFTEEQAKLRKKELLDCFSRMSDYAVTEEVAVVLLCGDVFDSNTPTEKDIRRFLDIIEEHPSVEYLYISGNHDASLFKKRTIPENFHPFGEKWGYRTYGNITVYGIDITKKNYETFYHDLQPEVEQINIVMLHGQIRESKGAPNTEEILLPLLQEKNIDYLALGHIHNYKQGKLDHRGIYCYSGCPEGRGYDEFGEKGFILLNTEETLQYTFIPFAKRIVHLIPVDISGMDSERVVIETILEAVKEISPEDLVRVSLMGRRKPDLKFHTELLEEKLQRFFFHASVKDDTRLAFDLCAFPSMSLEGTFYRIVHETDKLSDQEKEVVLRLGLSALKGEEVSFQ